MGFSHGEFCTSGYPVQYVHWEAGDRFVSLYNDDESETILLLTHEEARNALRQLRAALYAATGEDPI